MNDLKKIINVNQTRATDNHSIEKENISSLALMEKAAQSFVNVLKRKDIASKRIIVVCGVGNNGGDGFAVCRLLRDQGFDANALLVKFRATLSSDCEANKNRVPNVRELDASSPIPDFSEVDLIIDALFGAGLNKPVTGFAARIIEAMNDSNKEVYSIDVPSGLMCDTSSSSDCIVKSSLVISFQRPKLSFFFAENSPYIQDWEVVDIGLDESFIQGQDSNYFILDAAIAKYVQLRQRQSHKGTYGHALIMAGTHGKMGAAVLASKACLHSGVGLLTVNVPKCGYEILQISIPEAMCITDKNVNFLSSLPTDLSHFDAIGVGPGIGQDETTACLLKDLLQSNYQALVIDADAINILSTNKDLIALLPENSILTPHIKEFDRLVGSSETSLERFEKQRAFSIKHKCIVVLKDAHTCISSQDGKQFFNTSGNQGMATGGSGDVLTGIITSLLAQKYMPLTAALIAVYFHGKAGDDGAKVKGFNALIASDIIEHIRIERM